MKTEAHHILDHGTARDLVGELGISRAAAEAIAQAYHAPRMTITRQQLDALPEHLKRQTLAWNPTITEDATP